MKALHVDSGRDWRGGQAQTLLLLQGLQSKGWDQVLACPPGTPLASRAARAGIRVHPVSIRGDLDALASFDLARLARRFRPDILHAHTAHAHAVGLGAARLSGVSARVVTRRSGLTARHILSRVKYRHGISRYIAISRHVADTLTASGVDPGRISIVYSGVRLPPGAECVSPALQEEARRLLGIAGPERCLAVVGALTAEKGQDVAIAALARMTERAKLVLLGEGPERGRLEARVARLGLGNQVILPGFSDRIEALWPAFDLILAPSRHEGLGTAVIEALGRGLPVLASAAGGLREILEGDRGGRILSNLDPVSWAQAADSLLRNEAARAGLAAAGKLRAMDFTVERMVDGTEAAYESVLGPRPRKTSTEGEFGS